MANKNTVQKKEAQTTKIGCAENYDPVNMKQVSQVKVGDKTYKVTVTFVPIPEEEAKMKCAIVQGIMRQGYLRRK